MRTGLHLAFGRTQEQDKNAFPRVGSIVVPIVGTLAVYLGKGVISGPRTETRV